MIECTLLIVDDDERQRQILHDSIREFNEASSENFGVTLKSLDATTFNEAMERLKSGEFDGAIVDLKLRADTEEAEGNTIIKAIRKEMRFPVFVLSAFVGKLDSELANETDIFKIKERTKITNEDMLIEMASLLKTGISKLFGNAGELSKEIFDSLQEVFWGHVAYNWNHWNTVIADSQDRKRILTRYLSTILSRKLGLTDVGLRKAHVAETYFIPPLHPHIYTGDILSKDHQHFLVLNPTCDMVPREGGTIDAEFILLTRLIPLKDNERFRAYFENKSDKTKGKVESLMQNKNGRYHYLPPYTRLHGFLVDFEDLSRVEKKDIDSYERIASVTEPFLKNIVARFTIYYSRLGQPDFDPAKLLSDLNAIPSAARDDETKGKAEKQ